MTGAGVAILRSWLWTALHSCDELIIRFSTYSHNPKQVMATYLVMCYALRDSI